MFKVTNKKTSFIVIIEQNSHIILVFLLLTLNKRNLTKMLFFEWTASFNTFKAKLSII